MRRISEYTELSRAHRDVAVRIWPAPCWAEPQDRVGADFCLERLAAATPPGQAVDDDRP